MRTFPPTRYGLLLALVTSVAFARSPDELTVIRTLKVSQHPSEPTHNVYVSGQVATVLRFEQAVDPARTKLLGWEGRFEPLVMGGKKVVVEPVHDLGGEERVPLLVTLADGTEISFLVRPPLSKEEGGWVDHQLNVFKDHDSYNAVLSSLYDSLKRERALGEENARLRKEENSVDHAYATLLANGEVKKTPFRRVRSWRSKNEDMDTLVELFEGPSKAAVVVHLKNTLYGGPWTFDGAYLTRDSTSSTARPFALRMERNVLAPGQSGRIAVVVDQSAFQTDGGQLADLALQIFRGDGLLQVAVALEHTLIRQ